MWKTSTGVYRRGLEGPLSKRDPPTLGTCVSIDISPLIDMPNGNSHTSRVNTEKRKAKYFPTLSVVHMGTKGFHGVWKEARGDLPRSRQGICNSSRMD